MRPLAQLNSCYHTFSHFPLPITQTRATVSDMDEIEVIFTRLIKAICDEPDLSDRQRARLTAAAELAEIAAKSAYLRVAAQAATQPLSSVRRGESN
jgi:hypothetical protein